MIKHLEVCPAMASLIGSNNMNMRVTEIAEALPLLSDVTVFYNLIGHGTPDHSKLGITN